MKELRKEISDNKNEELYIGTLKSGEQISIWINKEENKVYIQDDDSMKGVDNISFELIQELANIIK